MVVLAHLQRRGVERGLRGREGFNVFVEIECLYSIALEESFGEVMRVFLTEKYSLDVEVSNIKR